jgi:hypothetical protein
MGAVHGQRIFPVQLSLSKERVVKGAKPGTACPKRRIQIELSVLHYFTIRKAERSCAPFRAGNGDEPTNQLSAPTPQG